MNRRAFVATTAGVGTALLAGCSGSGGGDDSDGGDGSGTSSFRLMISDQPAAIRSFDSLNVSLSSARIHRAEDDETMTPGVVTEGNATSSETTTDGTGSEGFVEFDLDGVTVDLTQVTGDRAVSVLADELAAGRYSGIELHVESVDGVVDGEDVDVMVPSNRLRIIKPFEVGDGSELDFVFDISVIKKGPNGYNLLPVVGKSGVAGEDVDVDEVETEDST